MLSGKSIIIDTSQPKNYLGFFENHECICQEIFEESVLEGLFYHLKKILRQNKIPLEAIDSCILCNGYGSTLSIRIALMLGQTLKTFLPLSLFGFINWQLYAFNLILYKTTLPFIVGMLTSTKVIRGIEVKGIEDLKKLEIKSFEPETISIPAYLLSSRHYTPNPVQQLPYSLEHFSSFAKHFQLAPLLSFSDALSLIP